MTVSSIFTYVGLTISILQIAFAQDIPSSFIVPPNAGADGYYSKNSIYAIGDSITLQWNTSWTDLLLILQQNGNSDTYFVLARQLSLLL